MTEPGSPAPQPLDYASPPWSHPNHLATWSVIVAIVGVIVPVLGGLLGLLLGVEAWRRTRGGTVRGRGVAILGIVLGALSMTISGAVIFLLPSIGRPTENANQVKCASNLRQIGQAILIYENDNQHQRPPDLGLLAEQEQLTANIFVCPDSSTVTTTAPVSNAPTAPGTLRAWINQCTDYVYVGAGKPDTGMASEIVIYEKPEDHHGTGMNVLFADGHVDWLTLPVAAAKIKAQTGHGP